LVFDSHQKAFDELIAVLEISVLQGARERRADDVEVSRTQRHAALQFVGDVLVVSQEVLDDAL
jgi:ribosomal protein L18E